MSVDFGDGALVAFNGSTGTHGADAALGSLALNALTTSQENVTVRRRPEEFLTSGSNNVIVDSVPRMSSPLEVSIRFPATEPVQTKAQTSIIFASAPEAISDGGEYSRTDA